MLNTSDAMLKEYLATIERRLAEVISIHNVLITTRAAVLNTGVVCDLSALNILASECDRMRLYLRDEATRSENLKSGLMQCAARAGI